jgi:hypothetical protein
VQISRPSEKGANSAKKGATVAVKGAVVATEPSLTTKNHHALKRKALDFKKVPNLNQTAWAEWQIHRRRNRLRTYTTMGVAEKLAKLSQEQQALCVQDSVDQCYQGIFPEKFAAEKKRKSSAAMSPDQLMQAANTLGIHTMGKTEYQLRQEVQAKQ